MRLIRTLLAVCFAAALAAPAAVAQSFQQRYQAAFADRMADPASTSALSSFIGIAVEVGLYDQAISAVEQHLIDHPLDSRAHLVAARLYYHLASRELARRHLDIALEIGTLDPNDRRAALRLLESVERELQGYSVNLEISAGIRGTSIDFVAGSPYRDRTDVEPLWRMAGQARFDLETPRNDAILLSGEIGFSRRFGDLDFVGPGDLYDAPHGRAAITFDVGLPIAMLPTLRGQFSAYLDHEAVSANLVRRTYGARARLMALPTADSSIYAQAGYGWLGASSVILLEQHRLEFEAGGTLRIFGNHAIGLAGRGQFDYRDGFGRVGHLYEAELSYGGEVYSFPGGPVWTHRAGVALGDLETPNIALGPAFPYFGSYWRAYWSHALQINDLSRVEFYLGYQETDFGNSLLRDQAKFDATLLYTFALY